MLKIRTCGLFNKMSLHNRLVHSVNPSRVRIPFVYQHRPSLLKLKEFQLNSKYCTLKLRSLRQTVTREQYLSSGKRYESGLNEGVRIWIVERSRRSHTKSSFEGGYSTVSISTEMEAKDKFTVDEAIEAIGFGPFQGLLLLYAGMAWTAEAMEMMLLSFVGPTLKDVWTLSPQEESFLTSTVFVGMMIGAYSWGFLSDSKGRRVGLFATSVLTFIAGLLSAFSPNYLILLLLRGVVGVGLGGGPVVSTWFMEFVPSANRGLWMIIVSLFWTLGSVLEALLAWSVMPGLGWRWLLGLSSIPLAVLLVFYPLVPESPRYLGSKGDFKSAKEVLERMAHFNKKSLPSGALVSSLSALLDSRKVEQANFECEQRNQEIEMNGSEVIPLFQDSSEVPHLSDMGLMPLSTLTEPQVFSKITVLLSPPVIQSTLLLWLVFFANAFTYYGIVLLSTQLSGGTSSCGVNSSIRSSEEAIVGNLYRDVFITSVAELPGLAVAGRVVDTYGRKHSMAGLFALCGIFMLPLMQHQSESLTTALLFGARGSIMGAFTVLYIYASEVYPTGMRTSGLGIANSFARIGGLLCPLVAVNLVRSCNQTLAVGLFALVPMTASILVLKFPEETKGQSLADSFPEFDNLK